jgi:hypothetical protein
MKLKPGWLPFWEASCSLLIVASLHFAAPKKNIPLVCPFLDVQQVFV